MVNIILITIVIIIYSKLAWNQLATPEKSIQEPISTQEIKKSDKHLIEYNLNLDFPDPFLKKGTKTLSNIELGSKKKKTSNPPIDDTIFSPPEISYLGRIVNISKKESKALIKYNNREVIINQGDSISDFVIHEIHKAYLIIKFNKKTIKYDIKK